MKSSTTIPQCRRIPLLLGLIVSLPLAALAQAGDLEPPGAPAPTMRTLDDIGAAADAAKDPRTPIDELPHTIDEPGSYYLAQNLSSDAGGIVIKASNVTLDLMGFTLSGEGSESGPGIEVEPITVTLGGMPTNFPRDNITITNGNLHGWSDSGIDAKWAENSRFESLHIRNNGEHGLVGGTFSLVQNVTASSNEVGGILLDDYDIIDSELVGTSTVNNSNANSNGAVGIQANIVNKSGANGNGGPGIWSDYGTVSESTATANEDIGIKAIQGSVTNSIARNNELEGIAAFGGSVTNSNAINNFYSDIDANVVAFSVAGEITADVSTGNATSD